MANLQILMMTDKSREFHNLIILHLPALRQQALSLTRHKAEAEDLVQSAIMSALAAQSSFEVGTNFRAWMSCIMRNRFFSNIRKHRFCDNIDDVAEARLAVSGSQESNLEMKELSRQIARLPADQRQILLMIAFDGMSYDDASEQLGVAVGTLKCRVFRARAQLEVWMRGQEQSVKAVKSRAKNPKIPTPALISVARMEAVI